MSVSNAKNKNIVSQLVFILQHLIFGYRLELELGKYLTLLSAI